MRVLSIVHDPTSLGGGGLFEEIAARRGERLDRWVVPHDDHPALAPDRFRHGSAAYRWTVTERGWRWNEIRVCERNPARRAGMASTSSPSYRSARDAMSW